MSIKVERTNSNELMQAIKAKAFLLDLQAQTGKNVDPLVEHINHTVFFTPNNAKKLAESR